MSVSRGRYMVQLTQKENKDEEPTIDGDNLLQDSGDFSEDTDDSIADANYVPSSSDTEDENAPLEDVVSNQSTSTGRRPKGRKRKYNNQTRDSRKKFKNTNKPYVNYRGIHVNSKEFENYVCKCKNRCSEMVSVEEREKLFKKYWELGSYDSQTTYLGTLISEEPVKRHYGVSSGDRAKQFTRVYKISSIKVCRDMFVKTLQISTKRVNTALVKIKSDSIVDKRGAYGGYNKLSSTRFNEVIDHIKRLPKYKSHYRREEMQDAEYLESHITIEKMHSLYSEEVENPVSYQKYKKIFIQILIYGPNKYYNKNNFKIVAIGHRPLLHLPDEIHINPTALKVTSEKSILLHNYGKIKAFYVTSISEPFTVVPAKGCLEPNEVVELDIQCTPTTNTNFIRNDLIIHCDDLEVKVPVTCMLQPAEWKKYATDLQEIEQRQRFVGYVKHIVDMEKRKSNKLEYMDTIDHEGHNICTRKFENNLEEEIEFLYKSEVFSILPMTGKLFPHQSMDFMVIFFPTANEVYLSTAYLDITGRSERLAVNLSGIGKGPSVIFNVTKLDIGSIFLEVTHEYQVVVKNDGNVQTMEIQLFNDSQVPIDYNISISNRACNTDNTCEFDIEPRSGIVEAYGVKTVKIKLTANLLDEIGERMIVMMYGSEMYQLAVPMKYKCGVPEVTTDPSEILINFCFINYEYTRVIKFINDTNLCGHLFYTPLSDPLGMKVSLDKTDFMICPGDIVELTLTICTYVPGLHEYPLMFTMSGEDKPKMMCKIKCNGQGPVVSYIPDELNFGNVTLLTTKIKKLRLLNDSPIPAVIKIKILLLNIEHGEQLSVNIFAEGVGYSILCEPILQPEYSFGAQLTHRVAKILINLTNLGRKYYRLFWTQKPLVKTFKELEDLEKLM
ncbi:unnamed protein product [Diabrotica balteata]|uniref:HYDIN/VesB/CFA65-like Ig-like domain-containing protein n=1 Tax=Diabrotica balteata TaxID=107213 RepID=A0A9N9X847_DIABA|nr:unnamed protein product [Diabrotica balteata]